MFHVVRSSAVPLADQLVEELSSLIESRRLAEGTRLPSIRLLARRAGVSAFTVTAASAYTRYGAARLRREY